MRSRWSFGQIALPDFLIKWTSKNLGPIRPRGVRMRVKGVKVALNFPALVFLQVFSLKDIRSPIASNTN